MIGDKSRRLQRALLLRHATETELVGWATDKIDQVRRARMAAHLELCTICSMRVERRQQEAAEGVLPVPEGLWAEVRPGFKRLLEPIAVAWGRLGTLVQALGAPALEPRWVAMTAGAADQGAADPRQTRKTWLLEDPQLFTSIELSVESEPDPGGKTQDSAGTLLVVSATVSSPQGQQEGRLEVIDASGASFLSGRLSKMAKFPARLPAGNWTLRVASSRAGEAQCWEIPLLIQGGEVKT